VLDIEWPGERAVACADGGDPVPQKSIRRAKPEVVRLVSPRASGITLGTSQTHE